MAAPRKCPDELRERAIRLVLDAKRDPETRPAACRRIGEQLGINPETLRGWVQQAAVEAGDRSGTTTSDAQRLTELERENRELRRANAILRSASAFFALVPDRSWLGGAGSYLRCPIVLLFRDVPSRLAGDGGRGRGLIGACLLCPTEACPPASAVATSLDDGLKETGMTVVGTDAVSKRIGELAVSARAGGHRQLMAGWSSSTMFRLRSRTAGT